MEFKFFLVLCFLYEIHDCFGAGCQLKTSGLTDADKKQIVSAHNKLRAKVANGQQSGQPSAANMKQLNWNDDLAAKAQDWANTCTSGHDTYDNRKTSKYPTVGQNYFASYAQGRGSENKLNFDSAVQAWYDEVSSFNRNDIKSYRFDPKTGHYTQVVWAETEAVGCGYVTFQNGAWDEKHFICNYGPAGNFIGSSIYIEGTAASKCSAGKSTQIAGLCN
uniref:Cysteine-rich venom protein n=1 Tax=Hemiscolopendra marginata TaxID=943146 RepID=A0A646QE35_9MYRI